MTKSELLQNAKPILFNTEMVRAIQDGRKTQTRRLPSKRIEGKWLKYIELVGMVATDETTAMKEKEFYEQYPPYQIGQVLYVRETYYKGMNHYSDGTVREHEYFYKANDNDEYFIPRWYPSIHMPKEAARIFLRVTNVRIERLQEMSDEDAYKEGYMGCPSEHMVYYEGEPCYNVKGHCPHEHWYCNHSDQEGFGRDIWNSTIKKSNLDRYGWDANPWVRVTEFERIEVDAKK